MNAFIASYLSSLAVLTEKILPFVVRLTLLFMAVITVLVCVLIAVKLFLIVWDRWAARVRRRYAPMVESYLAHPAAGIPPALQKLGLFVRPLVQYVLIHRSFGTAGPSLGDIAGLYDALGFVDRDFARLRHPFWWVRAEGARCLGQMKSARAKTRLLERLRDPSTDVRLMAAWSLGRLGDTDSIGLIMESLVRSSRLAGMRLSSTVFELGDKAVAPLEEALSHADPAVRVLALHLLGELKSTAPLPRVAGLTRPPEDREVRLAAYKALGTIGAPAAYAVLAQGLDDPLWEVRAQAARAIGMVGAVEGVPLLRQAVHDGQWWVRRNAGEALLKLGEPGRQALREIARGSVPAAAAVAADWIEHDGFNASCQNA